MHQLLPCLHPNILVAHTLDLDIDLGKYALAMRCASEGGQIWPDGIHQLSMKLAIGHCQSALQHIVGIWVLQHHMRVSNTRLLHSCSLFSVYNSSRSGFERHPNKVMAI